MKRTLVTALLLPFFLLTVGSLGCKAAALPLSAPVAAAMAEEGLSSTQQSACYSQQAGALEQLTRQKTRQLWEEHLSDALPQTARQQLEDWYGQEPFEQNRWDWGEVWQRMNRSIQDKLRTLLHELLSGGKYLELVTMPVSDIREENEPCRNCQYWRCCMGGCRAIALAFTKDYKHYDPAKCAFFKGGYMQKLDEVFESAGRPYVCLSETGGMARHGESEDLARTKLLLGSYA